MLELAFETFARQWATQLTAKVRVVSQITCDQVLMLTYDDYAASLPATTAMVLCSVEGADAKAVIQFPTTAALGWVALMLGATGPVTSDERVFSQIEQALIRRLMDNALEDLHYSMGALILAHIEVDAIQYNSRFAQAAATSDLMIVASFSIRVGDVVSPATVALPAAIVLPQLGEAHPSSKVGNARDLVHAQLVHTPVDVALQLASAKVTPGIILGLAVGDVLPIPHPHHRPLDLTVNGTTLATAAVGAHGSRLACVIVTTEENS